MDSKLIKSLTKKCVSGELINGQNNSSDHDQYIRS